MRYFFRLASLILILPLGCQAETKVSEIDYLLDTHTQVLAMQTAIKADGSFTKQFLQVQNDIDAIIADDINVPYPKDAGGGYTHEVHKRNYNSMYHAGRLFLISQDQKYVDYIKAMLNAYAEIYPDLPLHPEKKEQSAGKLFWQSLNEAVWLVHSIQAYDAIKNALTAEEQQHIENNVFIPMALYLSEESPQTFNKIHNHGTWATAAVGMTGYVLNKPDWVEKSLYGLDKSGNGGYMRQLDELFSPQGYYNEGPYYQRYALMPFVTFAKAIDTNEPERKIFEHRDSILLKAIHTTIQLSYNGLFYGINDAIKDKGINTIELVHGVAIAFQKTQDFSLLDIASKQDEILLTAYGLSVANALDAGKSTQYVFKSTLFGDGVSGEDGALAVLHQNQNGDHQALVYKATSQGLGHGHFDKLHWLFFNDGEEVVLDYGAARFLNIEAKFGGHYLPENDAYAKQTISHNTLVVDETSHFDGKTKVGNKYHPTIDLAEFDEGLQVVSATMQDAYPDVIFSRTMAFANTDKGHRFVLDLMDVSSDSKHQYDLPLHYNGQFIEASDAIAANTTELKPLGETNGYQYLWLEGVANPSEKLTKVTWLNGKTFYTYSTSVSDEHQVLHTRVGANDPNMNLVSNRAFIQRVNGKSTHSFLSLLEIHGEYNGSKEYTLQSKSQLTSLEDISDQVAIDGIRLIKVGFDEQTAYLIGINKAATSQQQTLEFTYNNKTYTLTGRAQLIEI